MLKQAVKNKTEILSISESMYEHIKAENAELKRQRDEAVELITLLFVFITKINDDIMNGSEPWHDEKPENWDNIHDELGIKHKTVKQFLANLKEVKDGED